MTAFVALAALGDAALVAVVLSKLARSSDRAPSLRMRLFFALAAAVLLGALVTGVYAVAVDVETLGFTPRLLSVLPKAFVLGSALLAAAAAGAALAGRRLARSVEQLADAATRIAEGERGAPLPASRDQETRRIARAIGALRLEAEGRPVSLAILRDAWHDLKTPIAAIRASVEVLEDGALDDPGASRRFVANIGRAAGDLDRMLADLVTLARLETAALSTERSTVLGALVADALDRVAPLATARGVVLDADVPARVGADRLRCDAAALSRAIGNLLENAVDATPGGRVHVSLARARDGGLSMDVVNEPACVARALRGRLFDRAATAGKRGGTGLGLAIARAAVEAHGGRMRFVELGPPRVRVRIELPA